MMKLMKSYRKELWFEASTRRSFINITSQIETCLRESGVKEGLVLVNAMHITASVFINDDESGLHEDYEKWLEKLLRTEGTILCDDVRIRALKNGFTRKELKSARKKLGVKTFHQTIDGKTSENWFWYLEV